MKDSLPRSFRKSNNGQAVLIILLVVAVILTIGLSIASRSVTDVKISQQTEESARVFWAAQAGLEQAIKANTSVATSGDKAKINDIDYFVSKSVFGNSNTLEFNDSNFGKVGADEEKVIWLVEHDQNGNLTETGGYAGAGFTISWGDGNLKPAILVTIIYKEGSSYRQKRFPFDTQARSPGTNFPLASCDGSGCSGSITFNLPVGAIAYVAIIRPYYLGQDQKIPIKIVGSSNFPSQGSCFESVASQVVSNISRKLSECRAWPQPSSVSYLLFSGTGGIEK